jgi:DNA excision repair protein ERCC-3
MSDGPLIVQSDKTLLLDIDHPLSVECRRAIAPFAELERAPEHMHTYRLTNLGLWNARAAGHDAEMVIDTLIKYSRYAVPHALLIDVAEQMSRYGRLRLEADPVHGLILVTTDTAVLEEVIRAKKIAPLLGPHIDNETIAVHPSQRGAIKHHSCALAGRPKISLAMLMVRHIPLILSKMVGRFASIKSTLLKVSGTVALAS